MNVGKAASFFAPVAVPVFARLSRSILKFPLLKIAGSGAMGSAETREDGAFTVYVEGKRGVETNSVTVRGRDVYGLTADISIYTARKMLSPEFRRAGVLSPAQALDSPAFFDWAREHAQVQLTV